MASPFTLPDLHSTRSSSTGIPSPDPFIGATHDSDFLQLRENTRRLRKAPAGPEAKNVDAAWEIYKKVREESLEICKVLLQKSRQYSIAC